jgi:hypothetical protein
LFITHTPNPKQKKKKKKKKEQLVPDAQTFLKRQTQKLFKKNSHD